MMPFWRKVHHKKKGITVYHYDRHSYHTSNPLEVEGHERTHHVEDGVMYSPTFP